MKRFTVPCDFGGKKAPFHLYIGEPHPKSHPLQHQAHWLSKERGGTIPQEVMEAFEKLHKIAIENDVSFEELCVYALGAAYKASDAKPGDASAGSGDKPNATTEASAKNPGAANQNTTGGSAINPQLQSAAAQAASVLNKPPAPAGGIRRPMTGAMAGAMAGAGAARVPPPPSGAPGINPAQAPKPGALPPTQQTTPPSQPTGNPQVPVNPFAKAVGANLPQPAALQPAQPATNVTTTNPKPADNNNSEPQG